MEELKAPEKIHVQPNAHDRWFEGKIPKGLPNGLFVEYTRTDAFIEKAAKWLDETLRNTDFYENEIELIVKEFKKAMDYDNNE